MEQQASDIAQLEEEKALVESKLAKQEAAKKELQNLRASLLAQKNDKNKLIDQLEAEQEKLANEKEKLEADLHETYEVSKDLETKIVTEQKRIAEIARQAEIARKEAAAKASERDKQNSGRFIFIIIFHLSQMVHGRNQLLELTHRHLVGEHIQSTELRGSTVEPTLRIALEHLSFRRVTVLFPTPDQWGLTAMLSW